MKLKKKRKGRLIATLCLLLCTLLLSVGGLSILKGVNAGEDDSLPPPIEDEILINDPINNNYNNTGANTNKKPLILNTKEECVEQINKFFKQNNYTAKSNGSLNLRGHLNGISGKVYADVGYKDIFERDSRGHYYWEEGFNVQEIELTNPALDTLFNFIKGMFVDALAAYNRWYFVNDDISFKQHVANTDIKYVNGMDMAPGVLEKTKIQKCSAKEQLASGWKYMDQPFRWILNEQTMENVKFVKNINGYTIDFDLVGLGIRDCYTKLTNFLPAKYTEYHKPGVFHYTFSLDRYGNVTSFDRQETILMGFTGKNLGINATGECSLNFIVKYDVKTKDDNFKVYVDDILKPTIEKAGYEV